MTAAFQLCAEETGKLLMMLLILLLLQSRVLASTSKAMMLTPSFCSTNFYSCSVYKATRSYALSRVPEDKQRKTSHWDELSSKSSAQAMEGSFLDLCAAAVTKLIVRAVAGNTLMCSQQAVCLAGANGWISPTSVEVQPLIPAQELS